MLPRKQSSLLVAALLAAVTGGGFAILSVLAAPPAYSNSSHLLKTKPAHLLKTKPGTVREVTVTPGDNSLFVEWTWVPLSEGYVEGYKVQWKTSNQDWDTTRQITTNWALEYKATITGLTNGVAYTVRVIAYNSTGDGSPSSEVSGTPLASAVTLKASKVEDTTVTLTITNHTGNWYYKLDGYDACTLVTGASANLTGLFQGARHTYRAYSGYITDRGASGCQTQLAAVTFLTKPGMVGQGRNGPAVEVTPGNGSLAVDWSILNRGDGINVSSGQVTGYKVQWKTSRQSYNTTRQKTVTTVNGIPVFGLHTDIRISSTITGLTNDVAYTVRVIAYNSTGDGSPSSEVSGTPLASAVTLAASAVEVTTATLTIANHTGNWYYRYISPVDDSWSCTSVAGSSIALSNLVGNTSYTLKAYSDSNCTTKLASSTFLTKPGKPAKPTVTAGPGSGEVTLSSTLSGGSGALSRWEYTKDGGTSWVNISDTDNTLNHVVSGLTNGTSYTFKVRAVNTTGTGLASMATTEAYATICNRTPAVRDAIVAAVSGKTTCSSITDTDLAGITGSLNLDNKDISSLKAGDFDGLTALTKLDFLHNSLTSLPSGIFDPLTALTTLDLGINNLSSLPAGIFDSLTSLAWLYLDYNQLTTLPPDVFHKLTSLEILSLRENSLTCLPFIPTSVTTLYVNGTASNHATCGAGVTLSSSSLSVGAGSARTYTLVLKARPNRYANSGNVAVTPSSSATGKATVSPATLTFSTSNWDTPQTVTVTGVAVGSSTVSHSISGGGYGSVTVDSVAVDVTSSRLSASAVTATTATLTLANHTGNWYYKHTTPTGGSCTQVNNGSTANLSNLTAGTNYTYGAYSAATCSENDELATASFTTQFATAPDPVASVTAVHNGSSLDVSWGAPARATHYHVTYSGNNGASWQLAALEHTGTSLTISGVDSSKTYIVGVRAKNAAGASGWVNSAPAATLAAPEAVASVTAVHQGSSLDVSWDAPARATHYHITYSDNNGASWQLAALEHTGTSLTISGVDSSKTYIVGVRAKNAAGASGWVNSAPAATLAAPEAVASVTAVHQGSSLDVSWDAPARATHYHITYSDNNGASWQLAALEHTGTSLTISGVDSSKTYIVGVRAKNAAGASGWVNSAPAAPPALSVANATAAEPGAGQSATLDFVVTLNRAASGTVTVDYATSDGTATAGADYTAASGTLSFAAGETSKTVSVTVLNDAHDEGSETLTLTLSNATGAVIGDGQATGTITNDDHIPQAWISRFGRTVADQVLDAVATRLRSEPTPGMEVTLAGERLGWSADADENQPVAQQAVEQLAQWLVVGNGESGDVALRTIQGRELVANSSFAFASPGSGGSLFSFWGRGAVTNFDGREGELSLDGEVTTWLLGTDWSWGQWPGSEARRSTAGLLLSRSRADGGYDSPAGASSGDVDATLTGVFPWGSHHFTDRLAVWGAVGYGQGVLEVTPKLPTGEDDATLTTDLNLWLAAAGLRGTLLDGGTDGLTITGKTDAMVVGTTSERVTGLEAAQATVTRLRLGLEAQRPFALGNPDSGTGAGSGAVLTPSLEMGLRLDGGDAETGFGLDLGGGILLSHPQRGLQAEVRGRGLLSHAAEGFRDQGFSGSLSWQQQPDSDLGAALSLSQTMGGSSSGGADALLSRVNLEGLAANNGDDDLNNQRLDLQLSYGFLAFGDRFTLTPELGLGLYDSGRDYRIGWRLTHLVKTGAFDLSFDVTRRESINNDGTAPDHGVQLEVNTRF